jgi:hypothetical protein
MGFKKIFIPDFDINIDSKIEIVRIKDIIDLVSKI